MQGTLNNVTLNVAPIILSSLIICGNRDFVSAEVGIILLRTQITQMKHIYRLKEI